MVRFHPRSLRFVGVPVARVLGKNEDRVQFSNEPLFERGHGPTARRRYGMAAFPLPSSILGDST